MPGRYYISGLHEAQYGSLNIEDKKHKIRRSFNIIQLPVLQGKDSDALIHTFTHTMDVFSLFWIPDFVVWILLFVIAVYIYGTWTFSTLSSHGYKGPKPKPLWGNVDLIFGQGHWGAWDLVGKKKYGKIFAMYEGRQPSLVVFDTDMLKQILVKDFSNFADRRDFFLRGDIMIYSLFDVHGSEWKRIRSLNSPFFTTGKLKRNTQLLHECTKHLFAVCSQNAKSGTDMDIKATMGAYAMESICLTAFGVRVDSQNDPNHILLQTMRRLVKAFNTNSYWFWIGFTFPFVIPLLEWFGINMFPSGTFETFSQLTRDAIKDRRQSHTECPDFIQAMIKSHEMEEELEADGVKPDAPDRGKALTEKEIIAQAAFFLMAGYETVATTLAYLLFSLANNQSCQEKLVKEINDVIGEQEMTYENLRQMTYLDMCMEESLRLYPPAPRTDRKCTNDVTINGCFIPKGTMVTVPIFGLHRDPDFWVDPDKFDPERFSAENRKTMNSYAYQPFGLGPRNCVGMRLAQIEVKMATIQVIKHFRVKVSKKTKLPLKMSGLGLNPEGGLHLQLEKR